MALVKSKRKPKQKPAPELTYENQRETMSLVERLILNTPQVDLPILVRGLGPGEPSLFDNYKKLPDYYIEVFFDAAIWFGPPILFAPKEPFEYIYRGKRWTSEGPVIELGHIGDDGEVITLHSQKRFWKSVKDAMIVEVWTVLARMFILNLHKVKPTEMLELINGCLPLQLASQYKTRVTKNSRGEYVQCRIEELYF